MAKITRPVPWAAIASAAAAALGAAAIKRSRRLDLVGAKVLVTGGTRGLGFATARDFVRRGADVAICARSSVELHRASLELETEAEKRALRLGLAPSRVLTFVCDVTDPRAAEHMVDEVARAFGRIDVLVNCAAEIAIGPVETFHATDFQIAFHRIFFSLYHTTMAAFRHMRDQRFGRIVNVASIGGRVPQPHLGTYVAAKFAVTGFSDTLAIEARKYGIRVTTMTPPPLRNAAFLNVRVKGDGERELRWFAKSLTSRFLSIDVERAARAIVDAARDGRLEHSVSPLGWLPARLYGVAPSLMVSLMSLLDRALPRAPEGARGHLSLRAMDVVARSKDPTLQSAVEAAMPAAERYMQPART